MSAHIPQRIMTINRKLKDINEQHNVRRMYELIKGERIGQPRLFDIKDGQGKMLTEKEEIANCWMEYYGNVFNWRDKEIEERTVKYCKEK